MIILSFLYALLLIAVGIGGLQHAEAPAEVRAFAMPGLFFGGAALLCSLFALRERRHGLSGVSFLSFLAFLTNLTPLAGQLTKGTYDWGHPAHRTAALVTLASACYLAVALAKWKRARNRELLAELEGGS